MSFSTPPRHQKLEVSWVHVHSHFSILGDGSYNPQLNKLPPHPWLGKNGVRPTVELSLTVTLLTKLTVLRGIYSFSTNILKMDRGGMIVPLPSLLSTNRVLKPRASSEEPKLLT